MNTPPPNIPKQNVPPPSISKSAAIQNPAISQNSVRSNIPPQSGPKNNVPQSGKINTGDSSTINKGYKEKNRVEENLNGNGGGVRNSNSIADRDRYDFCPPRRLHQTVGS